MAHTGVNVEAQHVRSTPFPSFARLTRLHNHLHGTRFTLEAQDDKNVPPASAKRTYGSITRLLPLYI